MAGPLTLPASLMINIVLEVSSQYNFSKIRSLIPDDFINYFYCSILLATSS
jgi:fructose-1,6-bisphosphatase